MSDSLSTNKLLLTIIAILIAPLAVGLKEGITKHFWINLILVFLTFGIGSLIHALWIVWR